MDHRRSTVASSRAHRRSYAGSLLVGLWLVATTSSVAALTTVPGEFQGKWVPSNAKCDSGSNVLVSANQLTLVNAGDKERLGGLEMAGPSYFAPGYNGIMAVLFTEFSGDQPVIVTFNAGEKRGVARVDFAPVLPQNNTPQLKAYNAHISKLNLAKRFPVGKRPLKKCVS
jgi:hypothetical protein